MAVLVLLSACMFSEVLLTKSSIWDPGGIGKRQIKSEHVLQSGKRVLRLSTAASYWI
jgi:hypothetical protein